MTFRCSGNVARFLNIQRVTCRNRGPFSMGFRSSSGKRILLTGPPGCGKTTVVRKVADLVRGSASGFVTEEARDERGQRIGFRVTSLDGKRGELARKGPGPG